MKSRWCVAVVLVLGGVVGGCEGEDKEVGAVHSVVPVAWFTGPRNQPLGAKCQPLDEWEPGFSGFAVTEVNLEGPGSPSCESGFCLINHFQGRVSCPYGQAAPDDENQLEAPPCLLPDGRARVFSAVSPQLVNRAPEDAATCACRCDGPAGTGPFCECPSGFECAAVLEFQLADYPHLEGSYCIKAGTAYDPNMSRETCDWETQSCGPV